MACVTGFAGRHWIAGLCFFLLQACGPAPAWAQGTRDTGLAAQPAVSADTTRTGQRWLLDVGALDDGGHAVAWLAREAAAEPAAWGLWVQRFDSRGRKAGAARELAFTGEVADLRQVAALVRRDASLVVGWATWRPYQEGVPGLMVATVRARHFGPDGKPRGPERVLDEALTPPAARGISHFEDLVMAQWRDGRYLVGWTVVDGGGAPPEFCVQRVAADGRPGAPLDRLGPMAARGPRLATLDAGGWLATNVRQADDGALYANITQVDVQPAIGLPLLRTLPPRAFVVDLREQGRLLVFGGLAPDAREVIAPRTLWFNPAGREAARTVDLPVMPTDGVALADGGWIAFWPDAPSGRIRAQRFDAHGNALGASLRTDATRAMQATVLPDGSLVLAWVGLGTDPSAGLNVFTQRFTTGP